MTGYLIEGTFQPIDLRGTARVPLYIVIVRSICGLVIIPCGVAYVGQTLMGYRIIC